MVLSPPQEHTGNEKYSSELKTFEKATADTRAMIVPLLPPKASRQ